MRDAPGQLAAQGRLRKRSGVAKHVIPERRRLLLIAGLDGLSYDSGRALIDEVHDLHLFPESFDEFRRDIEQVGGRRLGPDDALLPIETVLLKGKGQG